MAEEKAQNELRDNYNHMVDFVCEQIGNLNSGDEKAVRSVAAEVVAEVSTEISAEVAAETAAESAAETATEVAAAATKSDS
ncbi:MAG: hypothetical protein F6K45_22420 [Kamptonema sp. SIO1D9]|nr:hypothetical protein [Kamptonema sp. SIO1D9]